MKEKIETAKGFICFYLALPLFVLMVLATGVGAVGSEVIKEDVLFFTEDKEKVNPSSNIIQSEISNKGDVLPILARDLSKDYNVLNATSEVIDENALTSAPLIYKYKESVPLVLVVHTHATECYAPDSQSFATADQSGSYGFYTNSTDTRSTDTAKNMIAIGEEFSAVLAEKGIGVIQCRVMHDKEDYNSAYANSRIYIEEYIEEYPSIKYVVDIHRDSLVSESGAKTKTLAKNLDGVAQVMLVNGTLFDNWEDNLSLALKFKKVMDNEYPSLSRPIYLRKAKYNLDLTRASLLLEVGTCANTLEEAKKAARLSAECFAKVIKQEN